MRDNHKGKRKGYEGEGVAKVMSRASASGKTLVGASLVKHVGEKVGRVKK